MNYEDLINLLVESFKTGVPKNITADKLREALIKVVEFANVTRGDYQGTATPTTNPGTPSTPVYYFAGQSGVYANFGGITVDSTQGINILSFNGSAWSKAVVPIDLSGYMRPSDVVDSLLSLDPDKPLSARQGSLMKPRILSEGQEFENIDRPDLEFVYLEVNENLDIINEVGKAVQPDLFVEKEFDRPDLKSAFIDESGILISEDYEGEFGNDKENKLIASGRFDRPDKTLVIVDRHNRIIWESGMDDGSPAPVELPPVLPIRRVWNPRPQESYNANNPDFEYLIDYGLLIEKWDDLLDEFPNNPDTDEYSKKTQIGISSSEDRPIYCYSFAPPDAKFKVLLTAGTHANEKTYIKIALDFMRILLSEWPDDALLEWIRWNLALYVIPCVSPDTLSLPERVLGSRGGRETKEFPVSWTKSGTTVTITFEENDFPDTNGRFEANEYFSGPGLEGRLGVTITESSDPSALRNYVHRISTVVNGRTITITEEETGGDSSGTATMCVWTDINRSWGEQDYSNNYWINFSSGTSILNNGSSYFFYENKGTRPNSRAEAQAIDTLHAAEEFDLIIDMHAPAGYHYLQWPPNPSLTRMGELIENMKKYASPFSLENFERLRETASANTTRGAGYFARKQVPYVTIEWGGGLWDNSSKNATDAMRWMVLVITELTRHLIK